jgi:hypothetical protein
MSFEPRKIEQWLKLSAVPLLAVGTLVTAVLGGVSWRI